MNYYINIYEHSCYRPGPNFITDNADVYDEHTTYCGKLHEEKQAAIEEIKQTVRHSNSDWRSYVCTLTKAGEVRLVEQDHNGNVRVLDEA